MTVPHIYKDFLLHTDASQACSGAALSQLRPDELPHPICYLSKAMTKAEKNYSVTYKELLAVVIAFKRLRHYLLGRHTTVYTDHAPLKGLLQHPELASSRVARWCMILAEYDFEIVYRERKFNKNADALSRLPVIHHEEEAAIEHVDVMILCLAVTNGMMI